MFKVAVSVMRKADLWMIQNKVHLTLSGEKEDLLNLQTQLELVKQDVNGWVNHAKLKLKDVHISIDFI